MTLFFSLLLIVAAQPTYPPEGFSREWHDESPKHSFRIEIYESEEETAAWLVPPSGQAVQLYRDSTSNFAAFLYVSPDEEWIVRVQKIVHCESRAWLYKRSTELHYAEIPHWNDQAWQFFREQTHKPFAFSRCFGISSGTWFLQSHSVLVALSGNDSTTALGEWLCYYDLQKHRFYVDEELVHKNRDRVSPANDR
jgi:hypothetical protein